MSNYLSSPIRIIDRSISRNRLISWSSILQKYADPAGIIAAYPLSSSLFVPLENYHLVTILGAAPSITYPRGQVCARHPSRYIPPFRFFFSFLFLCSRVSSQLRSRDRMISLNLFVKRGIVSTISEIGAEKEKGELEKKRKKNLLLE